MRVNTGKIPPGGWHFEVAPGLKITGETYEKLLDRVFEYRIRGGRPIGNIRDEVDKYYCSRWPEACVREPSDYGFSSVRNLDPMSTRVSRHATMLAQKQNSGGFDLVNQDVAERRASVCADCPMNVVWKTGCSSCSSALSRLLISLRRLRNTQKDSKLMACKVCGHDNQTEVHLPEDIVKASDEELKELPENCWKRSL